MAGPKRYRVTVLVDVEGGDEMTEEGVKQAIDAALEHIPAFGVFAGLVEAKEVEPPRKGEPGSISHGTLRGEDLLEAFSWELGRLDVDAEHAELIAEAEAADPEADEVGDILSALEDALTEFAPPYCYFGASEGDGSDFGFWPSMDAIDELPAVEGADEARRLNEDCKSVNDHGNVTVYDADGNAILELV